MSQIPRIPSTAAPSQAGPGALLYSPADFNVSPAFISRPLQGHNSRSADVTRVDNKPIGPDGHELVIKWIEPGDIGQYVEQGFRPVPARGFTEKGVDGRPPMVARAGSCKPGIDGKVYRENGRLLAVWTSWTNDCRIEKLRDEAARRAQGALTEQYRAALQEENERPIRGGARSRGWAFDTTDTLGREPADLLPPGLGSDGGVPAATMAGPIIQP